MISYKPLVETLKKKKMSIYELQIKLANPRLRQTLNSGRYITLETVDRICQELHCKVTDVVIYEEGPQIRKEIQNKEYVVINWKKLKALCVEKRTTFNKMSIRMDKSNGYLSSISRNPHIGLQSALNIADHFAVDLNDIIIK